MHWESFDYFKQLTEYETNRLKHCTIKSTSSTAQVVADIPVFIRIDNPRHTWEIEVIELSQDISWSRKPVMRFGLQREGDKFPKGFYGFDNEGRIYQNREIFTGAPKIEKGDQFTLRYAVLQKELKISLWSITEDTDYYKAFARNVSIDGSYELIISPNGEGTKIKFNGSKVESTDHQKHDFKSAFASFSKHFAAVYGSNGNKQIQA